MIFIKVYLDYTIFIVFLFFGSYTNKSESFLTREQATHSYPCEKNEFSKFSPHTCFNCPCNLLMIIAKASHTGSCKSLNSNGLSVGVIGMHGNSTCSPLNFPFKITALIMLLYSLIIYIILDY
jgi:hypothetical protein